MLHHDRHAVHRLDERRVHFGHLRRRIELARIRIGQELLFHALVVLVVLPAAERNEIVEPVAAVDAQRLAKRHEAVRRIAVAAMDQVLGVAPVRLAVALAVGRDDLAKVVDVGAFDVVDLAEHAHAREIELQELDLAVDAVLELHAGHLELLARLDELPALVNGERARHLDERDLAAQKAAQADRMVQRPRRRAVDDVAVAEVAEILVGLVADVGLDLVDALVLLLPEPSEVLVNALLPCVAERNDVHAGNHRDAMDRSRAALTDADESDANALAHQLAVDVILHLSAFAETETIELAARGKRRRTHPRRTLEELSSVHFILLVTCNLKPETWYVSA